MVITLQHLSGISDTLCTILKLLVLFVWPLYYVFLQACTVALAVCAVNVEFVDPLKIILPSVFNYMSIL